MSSVIQIPLRKWVFTTILGWILGIILIIATSTFLEFFGITDMQLYIGLSMGIGIGFLQWILLRKYLNIGKLYLLYSIIGLCLPYYIIDTIPTLNPSSVMLLGSCVGGTFAAYLQSTTFPHKSLNTSKWVLFSGIAWILSSGLIQLINLTNELKYFIPNVFLLAIWNLFLILSGGPILGLLTGIALKYPAKIP